MDLRKFLLISARHLRQPLTTTRSDFAADGEPKLRSWCSWTTFGRLARDAGYWTAELPLETELGEQSVADGGTWGQPFGYRNDLAHIIIPRAFIEEPWSTGGPFRQWDHRQDIDGLSALLRAAAVEHRLSDYALEVKLF